MVLEELYRVACQQLDALGFAWDAKEAKWEDGFAQLEAFRRENQHCMVPTVHVTDDGYPLGRWVVQQREARDRMRPDRRARLDAVGFVWGVLKKRRPKP